MKPEKHDPHNFVEHLIARTMSKDSGISIKPAITPDVLPYSYQPPERRQQQFVLPFPLISSQPSDLEQQQQEEDELQAVDSPELNTSQEKSKSKQGPASEKEEDTTITSTIPSKELSNNDTDALLPFQGNVSSSKINTTKDIDDQEHKGFNKRVGQIDPAKKIIIDSSMQNKLEQEEEEEKGENRLKIVAHSSENDNQLIDQKNQERHQEKIYKHISFKSEFAQVGPTNMRTREKQFNRNKTRILLSPIYTNTNKHHHRLQVTKENLETSYSSERTRTVTINIGRIDVRATLPQKKPSVNTRQSTTLSLKDYLKQRSGISQ